MSPDSTENPPSDPVSDLVRGCFSLPVNPVCLHMPHLLSDVRRLPESLPDIPQRKKKSTTCCFPSKVGVWAYKETEVFLIHLWVTCVGGESRRDGKTEAGCAALWSVEAIVGVGDDIAAFSSDDFSLCDCWTSERDATFGSFHTRLMPRVKGFRQVTGRISVRVRKRLRERILPLRCLRAAMCRSGRTRANISRVSQMRPG